MFSQELLIELQDYIESQINLRTFAVIKSEPFFEKNLSEELHSSEIEDFINLNRKPNLQEILFGFIDRHGGSDADIYKKAGIDRRHFSKIRSSPDYRPGKNTVIALALALELEIEEADDLMRAAGYSLSDSDTTDLVIQFCLEKKIYNIDSVNHALDYFSLKPLIGVLK